MSPSIKYKVGDTLEVSSFAGPKVYIKVLKLEDRKSKISGEEIHVVGFKGCLVRRNDLLTLKKHGVPYTGKEPLKSCISFTYDWQVINKITKRKKGAGSRR